METETAVKLEAHEHEIGSLKHRVRELEAEFKAINELTMSVNRLAVNMENMLQEQKAQGERLETLLSIRRGEWKFDEIMAFADEKKSVIEAGKGSLPPDCDKGKVDELIASVMKEAGVS